MSDRICSKCGKTYPLDRKHFRWKVQDGKGHFTPDCLVCFAQGKKQSKKRAKARQASALRQIEDAGAQAFLRSVAQGGSNIPHSAEVIERVMQYFGGVAGFSAMLVKQYYDAPPGGSTRSRLLETMCRLVSKNVDQGGTKRPLNLWSEEELEQELDRRFERAVANFKGVTLDGQEEADQIRIAQEAEASLNPAAALPALTAGPDAVRTAEPAGTSGRTEGTPGRGPAALQAEPEPGEGSPVEGE
jgi:hypothetical protein